MASIAVAQQSGVTARVLDALAADGVITNEQVATIEAQTSREGRSPGRDVIARGLATETDVAAVLEDVLGVPRVDLQSYAPDEAALRLVPAALARELGVLPLFEIEGVLTVAIGRARDVFVLDGMGARIGMEVEAVLGDSEALQQALEHYYPGLDVPGAPPVQPQAPLAVLDEDGPLDGIAHDIENHARETEVDEVPPAFEHLLAEGGADTDVGVERDAHDGGHAGAATGVEVDALAIAPVPVPEVVAVPRSDSDTSSLIDLDVLAVADPARTMLLVTEILERAVYLGATKIHVIPGGSDFTVAFRIAGELVPLASAPISLEPSLVEGVRTFMGLPKPALGQPSVGRLHFEVAGVGVTFSLSAIKALSGWHMVVSVGPGESVPAPLSELGFGEPDLRTLKEIIARRSGLLLIAAPAGEGASDTYYSALSEAISAGRTAFSIEQSIARAVPGAAQVAVAPGSPAAASAYISAALGQDTDVIAIDPVETLTDMRLALEAAAAGKLVVVTFAASSAATAVQRTLRMGVDSASLASALAAIVAQRVVSTVCGACAVSDESGVALHLAGNVTGERGRVGAGCSACHDTGNAGRTHLFEVVRATDSVRAAIEAEATAVEFAAVVSAEGMTSFQTDALAKLSAGIVSGSELSRVLHFAG